MECPRIWGEETNFFLLSPLFWVAVSTFCGMSAGQFSPVRYNSNAEKERKIKRTPKVTLPTCSSFFTFPHLPLCEPSSRPKMTIWCDTSCARRATLYSRQSVTSLCSKCTWENVKRERIAPFGRATRRTRDGQITRLLFSSLQFPGERRHKCDSLMTQVGGQAGRHLAQRTVVSRA